MRQIFSWTVGSFFRTIGRTVALLAMGALLYYIASRLGFGLSDLFFDKVNASQTGVSSIWQGDMWNQNGTKLPYGTFGFQDQFDATQGGGSQRTVRTIYFNSALSTSGGGLPIQDGKDYISFRYTIWTPLITSTTNDFAVSFLFWTQNSWGAGANCEVISDSDVYLNNASKIVKMYVIKCPILNNSSTISALNISFNATGNTLYNHELSGDVLQYSSVSVSDQQIINSINNQTQSITDNQNQNAQSIIEQNQNSTNQLLDTNSTATEDKADSFFGSFDTNETYGGLSSIVTAPLVVVNQMLSNTCVAPSATWKGATITLPCGDMFWSRPGAVDLQNLLNVFYGGFICYYAIRKLFLMIENFKDPTHDKIEVTDL